MRRIAATLALLLIGATAAAASADDFGDGLVPLVPTLTPLATPTPGSDAGVDGADVSATAGDGIVITSQPQGGRPELVDPADGPARPPVQDRVPPPCYLEAVFTGAQAAANGGVPFTGFTPERLAQHATEEGAYYFPRCRLVEGDTFRAYDERFLRYREQFPPPYWIPAGTPVPDFQVPVEDLLLYAVQTQQRTVPAPVVGLNPEAQTVTGLQTWVWPRQQTFTGFTVRATAGTQFAEVTVTPRTLTVTAPGADAGPCTAPVVYEAGLPDSATDCWLRFSRSSAGSPGGTVPVTVTATFTVTWSGSDGTTNAPLPDVTTTSTVPIGVAQVQSVVR